MSNRPEKIYAFKTNNRKNMLYSLMSDAWSGDSTEYIRADVVERERDELKAMVNELNIVTCLLLSKAATADDKRRARESLAKAPAQSLADVEARVEGETAERIKSALNKEMEDHSCSFDYIMMAITKETMNHVIDAMPRKYK